MIFIDTCIIIGAKDKRDLATTNKKILDIELIDL
jgi:hypothetical protein